MTCWLGAHVSLQKHCVKWNLTLIALTLKQNTKNVSLVWLWRRSWEDWEIWKGLEGGISSKPNVIIHQGLLWLYQGVQWGYRLTIPNKEDTAADLAGTAAAVLSFFLRVMGTNCKLLHVDWSGPGHPRERPTSLSQHLRGHKCRLSHICTPKLLAGTPKPLAELNEFPQQKPTVGVWIFQRINKDYYI